MFVNLLIDLFFQHPEASPQFANLKRVKI